MLFGESFNSMAHFSSIYTIGQKLSPTQLHKQMQHGDGATPMGPIKGTGGTRRSKHGVVMAQESSLPD